MAESVFSSTRGNYGSTITQFPGHAKALTVDTLYEAGVAVYAGVGGDLEVIPLQGDGMTSVTFKNVPDGAMLPVVVQKIVSGAGTTATDLVGIY